MDVPATPPRGRNASPAAGQRALSASPAGRKSPSYWGRTQSVSPGKRYGGVGSPSFERSPARKATSAYPFDDRSSNRGVQSSPARDDQSSRRRTFKRQSIITDRSPPTAQGQYADDRHDHEERDDSRWESRQEEEEEGETPKSRNCNTTTTNPRSGNKSKYSPYPPRPNSARGSGIERLPEVTEEQGSVAADDDNRTVFTEQQEARKVRLELEEMLYHKDGSNIGADSSKEKMQHAPAERHSSSASESSHHSQMSHKNDHEYHHPNQNYRTDDDDHSVASKKSHQSRYHQQADEDDDDQSMSSRRSISSNKFDGDVDRFRKRFIVEDSAQHNRHGHGGVGSDDTGPHSQDLQDEFETLITKMKRDNSLLKRKFHHERQKNEDLAYDLQLTKEEMRGLKHEIRAMDAERDDLEDRMASAETKLKKTTKQKKEVEADLTGRIEDLEGKLQKSEASAKSIKETLEVASKASQDKVASSEILHAKLAEELEFENEKLKIEMQELEEQLHGAEIQAARVPALETLLEQQADLKNNDANDDATIGTQHLVERKLDIAGSQIATLEKSLTIKERTVQALEQEIADLKHAQKRNSSAGVEKLKAEIVNLKRKLREYEAMDLQSLLRQSQSSIEDLEKEKTRIEAKYNNRTKELEAQLKEKHNELSGTKDFLLTQLESIMGQQKQTSEQSVKNMESLLSKVTKEKSDVEDALKTLQATYRELHGQNEAHRAQLQEARTAITELQRLSLQPQKDDYCDSGHSRVPSTDSFDVRGYLESKIDALGKEKDAAIVEYQQKLEHCHMKINSLERELSTSQDKIKKITMEFSRSNSGRHSSDGKDAARLRAELDSFKRKNMHLEETIYIMKDEIRELEAKESSNSVTKNNFTQQDKFQIEKMKSELQDAHLKRRELEKKVADMQTLLGQAESVIAKTNAVAIKSVMDALKRKEQQGGGRSGSTRHPPYY
jgi:hypothetical protein